MKNRYGKEYSFVKYDDNLYRFNMSEEDMKYMRYGGKDHEKGIDMNDLGMFDPPGGPYVAVGGKIYWDEIYDGVEGSKPLIVKRIMDRGAGGLFVEVEFAEKERLRAKKKQIYKDLKDAVEDHNG